MKPYKFSKEAGRYIPTTKKGNRKFYYKRLSKLVECDFDPQSTFGKCIMKRLLGKLRFQRRCEKELSSYNFDLERKKESLNEEVKEFESKTYRNYKFEINKTAEDQANSEKLYLKPLKFIPLIVTVSYFIFFLQLNSPFEAVFFSAIIIYFFIRYPVKNHYDNTIKKYEHKARESYQKKKPDELIREFKIKKENEIKEIRDQIKISQAKLENVKSSIKNTFYVSRVTSIPHLSPLVFPTPGPVVFPRQGH